MRDRSYRLPGSASIGHEADAGFERQFFHLLTVAQGIQLRLQQALVAAAFAG
jgi:hypothetical protein